MWSANQNNKHCKSQTQQPPLTLATFERSKPIISEMTQNLLRFMILCPQQTGVLNFWMIIRETIDSVMLEGQITQIDIT